MLLGPCVRPSAAPRRALRSQECSVSGRAVQFRDVQLHPRPAARSSASASARGSLLRLRASAEKAPQGGDDLIELERQLAAAVQLEDFAKAARLRDLIKNAKEDDEILAKYANAKFYKAFESRRGRIGSYPDMKKVWGHGDHVSCLHPGADCICGRDEVLESWSQMFDGPGKMKVKVEDVRVFCSGNMAFVTCVEVVDAGEATGRLTATNVFEKQSGSSSYSIIHHHACPTN